MGSGPSKSTPVETPTPKIDESTQQPPIEPTEASSTKKEKVKRTGIDLVNHKCRKKKAVYDKCFSQWYSDRFLTGKSINQEEECGEFFEAYRQCYMKKLKREFFDKGQKKVKEGSMLAEELDEE